MKQPALVLIKPDGISNQLIGNIFTKFAKAGLDIIGIRMAKVTREMAEKHYKHLKGEPFFNDIIAYLLGEFHKEKRIMLIVYYGDDAIRKCRKIAGDTNPE